MAIMIIIRPHRMHAVAYRCTAELMSHLATATSNCLGYVC